MTLPAPRSPWGHHRSALASALVHISLDWFNDDTLVMSCSGEIDVSTVASFQDALTADFAGRARRMVLDLSEVTFFSAAGANAVMDTRDTGVEISVIASRIVRRILDAAGLTAQLACYQSLAEALRATGAHGNGSGGSRVLRM